jgi:hypothetical protein
MTQLLSDAALELLARFESLPEREQHELLVRLLRRTDECPGSVLAGDELAGLADELFRTLDEEEVN